MRRIRLLAPFHWGWGVVSLALLVTPAYGVDHRPRITIRIDGEPFVDTALRDNEPVTAEQLGNYLGRIAFRSTKQVPIKADPADGNRAVLKGKFELQLTDNRKQGKGPPVLKVTFTELRLLQSKFDREGWFITPEGLELIEKALKDQKK